MAKKVLVVDDEEDIRETIALFLKKNGYEVRTAVNGDDCLEKVREEKPDMILLDIMMPGTPVIEVVRQLPNEKIVFCTVVRTSDSEREKLLTQKNILGFIQKPFDIDDLLAKVKETIGE